jgi:hypothetical protein
LAQLSFESCAIAGIPVFYKKKLPFESAVALYVASYKDEEPTDLKNCSRGPICTGGF